MGMDALTEYSTQDLAKLRCADPDFGGCIPKCKPCQARADMQAAAFVFNPPPASEWEDSTAYAPPEPQRLPYELRRTMIGLSMGVRVRRDTVLTEMPDGRSRRLPTGPERYYRACKRAISTRQPCNNEIEVYKVVTGSHTVEASHDQGSHQVTDYVYYWPDTAIVLEVATEYAVRPVQHGFCSWKCASLWTAKQSRDTES